MRAFGCLLVLLALTAAGCGGGEDGGSGGPSTSAQLIAGFSQRAGGRSSRWTRRRPTTADKQGIVWGGSCFKEGGLCQYTATKRLADNVVLVWDASAPRTTDARWRRRSTALAQVIAKPPSVRPAASATATTAAPAGASTTTAPTTPASKGTPIPASRVIAAFKRLGNVRLDRDENPGLGPAEPDRAPGAKITAAGSRLIDRFGVFSVYVLKGGLDARFRELAVPPPARARAARRSRRTPRGSSGRRRAPSTPIARTAP
jgi:hypothetical protein